MRTRRAIWSGAASAWLLAAAMAAADGPLRVHPSNPRYFADASGRAVLLTGSHTWNNLQDIWDEGRPAAFDFNAYLDFLARHDHNFIRLWRWELTRWDEPAEAGKPARKRVAENHPWRRTGPGAALDGGPRFDLRRFDEAYFDRLRTRVAAAQDRGIYVSVMLFEGWGLQHLTNGWRAHPFHAENNVNGIDGDPDRDGFGTETHTLRLPAVTRVQEAYVRKVVETVGGFDRVLYEIANESGTYSTEWQAHFVRYVHDLEQRRGKSHPVGMTFQYSRNPECRGTNANLFRSPADWISPNPDAGRFNYRTNPPPALGAKVIVSDTDHLWGIGGTSAWVWKSFLRGANPIFMDPYGRGVLEAGPDSKWEPVRRAMGVARRLSEQVDLAAMTPRLELAGSGYCLAEPGRAYIVYLPDGGPVAVDLSGASGPFEARWIHPVEGTATKAKDAVEGGARRTLSAPFPGDAVLHLRVRR